ncbi:MAG TPA: hypothetical protein VF605_11800 [Allosphingosinicella sp.]|jgi:hypothetical protein
MPVSKDLRTITARLSVAIAGDDTYGRTELSRLRQELDLLATDAEASEGALRAVDQVFAELSEGLERGIEGLQRLERRARLGAGQ